MRPSPDARAAPALDDRQCGVGERGDDGDRGEQHDLAPVGLGDGDVDDPSHDEGSDEREERGEQDGDEEQRDRAAVRTGERPDASERFILEFDSLDGIAVAGHHRMR